MTLADDDKPPLTKQSFVEIWRIDWSNGSGTRYTPPSLSTTTTILGRISKHDLTYAIANDAIPSSLLAFLEHLLDLTNKLHQLGCELSNGTIDHPFNDRKVYPYLRPVVDSYEDLCQEVKALLALEETKKRANLFAFILFIPDALHKCEGAMSEICWSIELLEAISNTFLSDDMSVLGIPEIRRKLKQELKRLGTYLAARRKILQDEDSPLASVVILLLQADEHLLTAAKAFLNAVPCIRFATARVLSKPKMVTVKFRAKESVPNITLIDECDSHNPGC